MMNDKLLTVKELTGKPEEITKGVYNTVADLSNAALINEAGMAEAYNVTGRTIRRMVTRGELPPLVRFGGKACWIAGRVKAWIDEMAARQESDAKRHLDKIRKFDLT